MALELQNISSWDRCDYRQDKCLIVMKQVDEKQEVRNTSY
jgi:hypothetical protein